MSFLDDHIAAAGIALGLFVAYVTLAFGLRTLIQLRRTGSSGFHGVSGRVGSAEWWGGVAFIAAVVIGASAPALQLGEGLTPVALLDQGALRLAGVVLAVIGIVLTLLAQLAMGTSWRIGVQEGERTELVMSGPFAIVRNPIFAAMLPTAAGLALITPSWLALVGVAVLVAALELQTRRVEEPYLLRTHGAPYAAYAARVGRFVPGVGVLPPRSSSRPER